MSLPSLDLSTILVLPFVNIIEAQKKITNSNISQINEYFDEKGNAHKVKFSSKNANRPKEIDIPLILLAEPSNLLIDKATVEFDVAINSTRSTETGEVSMTGTIAQSDNSKSSESTSTSLSILIKAEHIETPGLRNLKNILLENIHVETEPIKKQDNLIISFRAKV